MHTYTHPSHASLFIPISLRLSISPSLSHTHRSIIIKHSRSYIHAHTSDPSVPIYILTCPFTPLFRQPHLCRPDPRPTAPARHGDHSSSRVSDPGLSPLTGRKCVMAIATIASCVYYTSETRGPKVLLTRPFPSSGCHCSSSHAHEDNADACLVGQRELPLSQTEAQVGMIGSCILTCCLIEPSSTINTMADQVAIPDKFIQIQDIAIHRPVFSTCPELDLHLVDAALRPKRHGVDGF
jgi:hypothetical protein